MSVQYYDGWAFYFDGKRIWSWRVMPMHYFPTPQGHHTTQEPPK
jgi:hypothetical protein